MSLQENMAASIRAIMKNRHKSLSEFSAELGISRNALYNYLRGRGNPSIATLEHMAKNLGVSPAALMLGEMKAYYYDGKEAEDYEVKEIPEDLKATAEH